ncbi:MAG: DMT family transporter, partial [Alphaproteobacteria bacterium]|nr:DMT family transporter [Alphaproteobacteria bacterium]
MNRSPRPALLSSVSSNLRGILFMVVFAATISTMHGVVRYMSAEVHPFEIAFFRNLTVFLLMIPLLLRSGRSAWRSARPGLQAARGFIGAMAMLTWFYALSLVPLADATALSFTVVVFTTVCAIIVLRERVGIRRWSAIGIGVFGTLIIL